MRFLYININYYLQKAKNLPKNREIFITKITYSDP